MIHIIQTRMASTALAKMLKAKAMGDIDLDIDFRY
jgi:hypothetical protein